MFRKFTLLFLATVVLASLLTSCASGYRTIDPEALEYLSQNQTSEVTLNYKYDVLKNKKYRKKEDKERLRLVAVKITNNSQQDLVVGRDIYLTFENGSEIVPLDSEVVYRALKQDGAFHLFYLLLTPTNIYYTETRNGSVTKDQVFPVGLFLGPGLTIYNLLVASNANKKFKKELQEYNIAGKKIKAGETLYGIVAIQSGGYEALKIELED